MTTTPIFQIICNQLSTGITTSFTPSSYYGNWIFLAVSVSYYSDNFSKINFLFNKSLISNIVLYNPSTITNINSLKIVLRTDSNTENVMYSYLRLWSKPLSPMILLNYRGSTFFDYRSNSLIDYWDFKIFRTSTSFFNKILLKNTSNISLTLPTNNLNYYICGTETILNSTSITQGPFCESKKILQYATNVNSLTISPPPSPTPSSLIFNNYTIELWFKLSINISSMQSSAFNSIISTTNPSGFTFGNSNLNLFYIANSFQTIIINATTLPDLTNINNKWTNCGISYSKDLQILTVLVTLSTDNLTYLTFSDTNDKSINISSGFTIGLTDSNNSNLSLTNFRIWNIFRNKNDIYSLRYKKLDGIFYLNLLYNFFFDNTITTEVYNHIQNNYDYTITSLIDGYHSVAIGSTASSPVFISFSDNPILCTGNGFKEFFASACINRLNDNYIHSTALNSATFNVMNGYDFTIELWINPSNLGSSFEVMNYANTATIVTSHSGQFTSNTIKLVSTNVGASSDLILSINTATSINNWIFVSYGVTLSKMKRMVIMDVNYKFDVLSTNNINNSSGTADINWNLILSSTFKGYIRSLRLYRVMRDPTIIIQNRYNLPINLYYYDKILGKIKNSLVIYLPLNGGNDITLYDTSQYSVDINFKMTGFTFSNIISTNNYLYRDLTIRIQYGTTNIFILCEESEFIVYDSITNSCIRNMNKAMSLNGSTTTSISLSSSASMIYPINTTNNYYIGFWIKRMHTLTSSEIMILNQTCNSNNFKISESCDLNNINIGTSMIIASSSFPRDSSWIQYLFYNQNNQMIYIQSVINNIVNLQQISLVTRIDFFINCDLNFVNNISTSTQLYLLKDLIIGNYPISTNSFILYQLTNAHRRNLGLILYFKLNTMYQSAAVSSIYEEISQKMIPINSSNSNNSVIDLVFINDTRFRNKFIENLCPSFTRNYLLPSSIDINTCLYINGLTLSNQLNLTINNLSVGPFLTGSISIKEFTFESYFKLNYATQSSSTTNNQIFSFSNFKISELGGSFVFDLPSPSSSSLTISGTANGPAWHHVAITFYRTIGTLSNNFAFEIYADNSKQMTTLTNPVLGAFNPFSYKSTMVVYGYVRLWSIALSEGEIFYHRAKSLLSADSNKLFSYIDFRLFHDSGLTTVYDIIDPSVTIPYTNTSSNVIWDEGTTVCGVSQFNSFSNTQIFNSCISNTYLNFLSTSPKLTFSIPDYLTTFSVNNLTIELWIMADISSMTTNSFSKILYSTGNFEIRISNDNKFSFNYLLSTQFTLTCDQTGGLFVSKSWNYFAFSASNLNAVYYCISNGFYKQFSSNIIVNYLINLEFSTNLNGF